MDSGAGRRDLAAVQGKRLGFNGWITAQMLGCVRLWFWNRWGWGRTGTCRADIRGMEWRWIWC